MEARLGSCDTREFIMVPARELAEGMLDGGEWWERSWWRGRNGGVVEVSGASEQMGSYGVRGDGKWW